MRLVALLVFLAMQPAPGFVVFADLPAGCELRAAGPIGAVRFSIIRAYPLGQARWLVQPPVAGRWLFAAVCGAHEIVLDPPVVEVPPARQGLFLLKVRR